MSKIQILATLKVPAAVGPYSQAVKAGGFAFCSGQIPLTSQGELIAGDIKAQTRQVLKNLQAVLKAAGSSLANVVKTTVYLSDIQNFAEFNQAYAEFFKNNYPARSVCESPHLPKGVMVEIEAVAYQI
ncbi:MAG: Rid family detoxifying hydrolase [Patescibacteria group bacterium]